MVLPVTNAAEMVPMTSAAEMVLLPILSGEMEVAAALPSMGLEAGSIATMLPTKAVGGC